MAMIITPPTRICDVCGDDITKGKAYQFPPPSVLINNDGGGFRAVDSSMTDICPRCTTERPLDVLKLLKVKAEGK